MPLSHEEKAKREREERADVHATVDFVVEFSKQLSKAGRLQLMSELQAKFSKEFREIDKRKRLEMLDDERRGK